MIDLLLSVAALPVLGCSAYLAMLAVLARRMAPPAPVPPRLCFDIVVPAHNEENEIAATVASLSAIDYPRSLFRIFVVADNCTDGTADRAARAGAQVLVRSDTEQRGKGYALAYAFGRLLAERFADVVVVVDADTVVSPNLLAAMAARFEAGSEVVQVDYGVRNPTSSWRTRLMTIALSAFHGVRSVARERLGWSCGLRGNGMGFSRAVLEAHPPQAFSIVEDLEYGINLGEAGIRVAYIHEARVRGYMAVSERGSRSQRQRWERGRKALIREHVRRLLGAGWRRRDGMRLDLALDLLIPPMATLVIAGLFGLTGSLVLSTWLPIVVAPWLWAAALGCLSIHVLQAWRFSGTGIAGLVDLLWVPVYLLWKITLRFRDMGKAPLEWIRTTREVRL
jgi:1,2-diacylglycerol 3-beta-glucosyltransferase